MAAFLPVDVLRAHAVPVFRSDEAGARPGWQKLPAPPRPKLIAHWEIGPGGRLTCFWQVEAAPLVQPPPD